MVLNKKDIFSIKAVDFVEDRIFCHYTLSRKYRTERDQVRRGHRSSLSKCSNGRSFRYFDYFDIVANLIKLTLAEEKYTRKCRAAIEIQLCSRSTDLRSILLAFFLCVNLLSFFACWFYPFLKRR